jgi:O-acetyl-ADP-ribose deacetylase (regulator of RNase III)
MANQTGKSIIELQLGDITETAADAIVNAANNLLGMGGGVAGAIKRAGGQGIEDEAVKLGPIPTGAAVITTGGTLKARYVIHAAVMGKDLKTDAEKIRSATIASLQRACELKLETIAFPALGTGVGRFPKEQAAAVMIEAIKESLPNISNIKSIKFVLFDQETFNCFKKVLTQTT